MRDQRLQSLLREPLLHFFILGAALFALLVKISPTGEQERGKIVVTAGQIDRLAEVWRRTWLREPTAAELEQMIDDFITEEIYYREALALGLDENDTVIRRRLKQKMEFLADDLSPVASPNEEALQALLAESADAYLLPARYSLVQIYFSVDRRGDAAARDAIALRERLNGKETVATDAFGDPISLPRDLTDTGADDVARLFGREFVEQIDDCPVQEWCGPIGSGFGLHLVWIDARTQARPPEFEEIENRLRQDWEIRERDRRRQALIDAMRQRYQITVEPYPETGMADQQ
jgi:parvulin-like peptidyl-prolyl isomerase